MSAAGGLSGIGYKQNDVHALGFEDERGGGGDVVGGREMWGGGQVGGGETPTDRASYHEFMSAKQFWRSILI